MSIEQEIKALIESKLPALEATRLSAYVSQAEATQKAHAALTTENDLNKQRVAALQKEVQAYKDRTSAIEQREVAVTEREAAAHKRELENEIATAKNVATVANARAEVYDRAFNLVFKNIEVRRTVQRTIGQPSPNGGYMPPLSESENHAIIEE